MLTACREADMSLWLELTAVDCRSGPKWVSWLAIWSMALRAEVLVSAEEH